MANNNLQECDAERFGLILGLIFNQVKLVFSRPGKPTDNAYIESFNGKLREECLNQHWFLSFKDAQEQFDHWRRDCNEVRPHASLGYRAPKEFLKFLAQASLG
jgi:transposase InsO family protein